MHFPPDGKAVSKRVLCGKGCWGTIWQKTGIKINQTSLWMNCRSYKIFVWALSNTTPRRFIVRIPDNFGRSASEDVYEVANRRDGNRIVGADTPIGSGAGCRLNIQLDAYSKSVFLIVVKSPTGEIVGQATGFAVDGNRIVTNEHVVRAGKPYLDLGAVRIGLSVAATIRK